jgi:hypothetical protein
MAFLTKNKSKICKILMITLVFEKKTPIYRRKLSKIAENRDHSIVVSSPPAPEEIRVMGREIESRQGIRWLFFN